MEELGRSGRLQPTSEKAARPAGCPQAEVIWQRSPVQGRAGPALRPGWAGSRRRVASAGRLLDPRGQHWGCPLGSQGLGEGVAPLQECRTP